MGVFARDRIATVALLIAMLAATAPAAYAKTYTPNKAGDPKPGNCKPSDCTLREAVIAANGHPGSDEIVLQAGDTYKLRYSEGVPEDLGHSGDLDVRNGPLTIESSSVGKRAIIDANDNFRVFETFAPTTFRSLTIKRGSAYAEDPLELLIGGGLFTSTGGRAKIFKSRLTGNFNGAVAAGGASVSISRSSLGGNSSGANASTAPISISRSTISGNEGVGAASNGGSISVSRSTVAGNSGGGIYVTLDASATVSRSTVRGNTNFYRGGINVYGHLELTNSTVSGNHATSNGGGLWVGQGSARLVNDTIDGNQADGSGGGAEAQYGAPVSMNAVTVAHNKAFAPGPSSGGGGIFTEDTAEFTVKNSIIAFNSALSGPDCQGSVVSGSQNLLSSDNSTCLGFSSPGDFLSVTPSQLKLGTLHKNGGPTKTDALGKHSKAINRAGSDAPSHDQRGVKRDSKPDIGAYERR
jgi:hypothetical protein